MEPHWYHRLAHQWDWLWRLGHQMHHSAEAVDVFGAYYLHPLDAALFTTWAVIAFYPLLGLTPEAGAIAGAFLAFNAAFQHANIRTPLRDMVFGTFRNPQDAPSKAGFYDGASARLGTLLTFGKVA
jgi:sterol desaturase/sphingolipid hydroxylase (fatty acid hydroxylase superfamily)